MVITAAAASISVESFTSLLANVSLVSRFTKFTQSTFFFFYLLDYRGYACNDDRVAESDAAQLTATLLLTLSNFMFLPAIFVAICRRFYVEALVYTYTMFFSTVSLASRALLFYAAFSLVLPRV